MRSKRMTATIKDLITVLQELPPETPVFTYLGQDGFVECCEYYQPSDEDYAAWRTALKRNEEVNPPHPTKQESAVAKFWQSRGLQPVLYIGDKSLININKGEEN